MRNPLFRAKLAVVGMNFLLFGFAVVSKHSKSIGQLLQVFLSEKNPTPMMSSGGGYLLAFAEGISHMDLPWREKGGACVLHARHILCNDKVIIVLKFNFKMDESITHNPNFLKIET